MNTSRSVKIAALLCASATLASCAVPLGVPGSSNQNSTDPIVIAMGTPAARLVPGEANELSSLQIMESLFTGLITYEALTTKAQYDGVASDIVTNDNVTFTINLKQGWTFHDDTPVTADSFIDAWNYTALSSNKQPNNYFMADIQGYDDLQSKPGEEARSKTMSGLKKLSDYSFSVSLKKPFAQWPLVTGYSAFYPLPKSFYGSPAAFSQKPIGNGPWKMEGEVAASSGLTVVRNDKYLGSTAAQASALHYRFIDDTNTAFMEVQSGSIDVATVPSQAASTFKDDFKNQYFERESSGLTYLGLPLWEERYNDKRVRQALSMAIDREQITEAMFDNARVPAKSIIPPVFQGHRPNACEYCEYNPTRARELLASTGFDTSKPIDFWFNSGVNHEVWVQAIGIQLNKNLGLEFRMNGNLSYAEYMPRVVAKGVNGPFRQGWIMDYPSAQNYLEPMFSTKSAQAGGANYTGYTNADVDRLIEQGNTAMSTEQAVAYYQEAETKVLEDMPVIPVFFGRIQMVHSKNVTGLVVNGFGRVDTSKLKRVA